jgi:hypothetical protein
MMTPSTKEHQMTDLDQSLLRRIAFLEAYVETNRRREAERQEERTIDYLLGLEFPDQVPEEAR